jgi:hypothetical protein
MLNCFNVNEAQDGTIMLGIEITAGWIMKNKPSFIE